jgi:class 3 adenylate cyclase
VRVAILEAYDRDALNMVLKESLGKDLDQLVAPAGRERVVFDLLERAKMDGWLRKLIATLADERPQNQTIQAVLRKYLEQEDARARLAAIDQPWSERRHLSIMACEIADRSELAKNMERESATLKLLNDLLAERTEEWGGFVFKRFDEAAIVYFEYPRPLEDGAEWAVRCALWLQRSRAEMMPDVHLRIGIHRGEILIDRSAGSAAVRFGGTIPQIAMQVCGKAELDKILVTDASLGSQRPTPFRGPRRSWT